MAITFPQIELIFSGPILDEFKDVISRREVRGRFDYSTKRIDQFVTTIRDASTVVETKSDFKEVREDPKDDIILNTAADGEAEFLVSGDRHLQRVERFKKVRIVSPRTMLGIISDRFEELVISKDLE
ncbi:MAG: putative toxin-antitoxin system toxin component, PIN family [Thaumarchaeota archaeon]|nr:MAG: putative toxin-antitoxin system toxin component, PIN family [Nitrososphaerota archaeon]